MATVIGNKNLFAVGLDIISYDPKLWGRSCIWLNDHQIGDFNDENILGPFLQSMMRIALKHKDLWFDDLEGLNCYQLFNTINPFHTDADGFYDLSPKRQKELAKYDIFILQFGENFDKWIINPIVKSGKCKFIWSYVLKDTNYTKNSIQCVDVPIERIQKVYRDICKLIPDQFWPTMIEKLR